MGAVVEVFWGIKSLIRRRGDAIVSLVFLELGDSSIKGSETAWVVKLASRKGTTRRGGELNTPVRDCVSPAANIRRVLVA